MSSEIPKVQTYQHLVTLTENFTIATCQERMPDEQTLSLLLSAILGVAQSQLPHQEILDAIREGIGGGVVLYQNLHNGGQDVAYWRLIREEAERHWVDRSRL